MHILENDLVSIKVHPKGAELHSAFHKSTKTEFIWQADSNIWGRHAPVLFPIVGQVKGGEYRVNEERFELSQHGFARDREFEMISESSSEIVMRLKSDSKTLDKFPYEFEFYAIFSLVGNRLNIAYEVKNSGAQEMLFSIGMHPGFTCPFLPNTKFDEYQLVFSSPETSDRVLLDNGLRNGEIQEKFLSNESVIQLSHGLFDDDAIILKNTKSESITLKHPGFDAYLSVGIKGFPYLGIWTKPKADAPFVCIEPWYGITDRYDASGEFKDRDGLQTLPPSKSFKCSYWIEVG